ncbi:hypothetical protein MMC20_001012 [Loxospora ochrophaea]|nr:hypothetical protein [Loxospora ochrophaea]
MAAHVNIIETSESTHTADHLSSKSQLFFFTVIIFSASFLMLYVLVKRCFSAKIRVHTTPAERLRGRRRRGVTPLTIDIEAEPLARHKARNRYINEWDPSPTPSTATSISQSPVFSQNEYSPQSPPVYSPLAPYFHPSGTGIIRYCTTSDTEIELDSYQGTGMRQRGANQPGHESNKRRTWAEAMTEIVDRGVDRAMDFFNSEGSDGGSELGIED